MKDFKTKLNEVFNITIGNTGKQNQRENGIPLFNSPFTQRKEFSSRKSLLENELFGENPYKSKSPDYKNQKFNSDSFSMFIETKNRLKSKKSEPRLKNSSLISQSTCYIKPYNNEEKVRSPLHRNTQNEEILSGRHKNQPKSNKIMKSIEEFSKNYKNNEKPVFGFNRPVVDTYKNTLNFDFKNYEMITPTEIKPSPLIFSNYRKKPEVKNEEIKFSFFKREELKKEDENSYGEFRKAFDRKKNRKSVFEKLSE